VTPGAIPLRVEWSFEIPSTLEAIDQVCVQFQDWRATHCERASAFRSELLLREALVNSVVHGTTDRAANAGANGNDKRIHGIVRCAFRAGRGRLLMAIRDEGDGFDWRAVWNRHADPGDTGGRGIEILRRYASAVRFNPKGNTVTLLQRF
jgi:anti-sigma regulatory factor (Ser/Thr protein kinase)